MWRIITIKPNDKTGGVSVLNTTDYIKSMDTLLQSKFTDSDGIDHPYFEPLEPNQADQLQINHLDVLKTSVKKDQDDLIISSEVADWLVPDEYDPGTP